MILTIPSSLTIYKRKRLRRFREPVTVESDGNLIWIRDLEETVEVCLTREELRAIARLFDVAGDE